DNSFLTSRSLTTPGEDATINVAIDEGLWFLHSRVNSSAASPGATGVNVRVADFGSCNDPVNGCQWSNSVFTNSIQAFVFNQGVTNKNVVMRLNMINDEISNAAGGDGVLINAGNSAVTHFSVSGSTFQKIAGTGFHYLGADNSSGEAFCKNIPFLDVLQPAALSHNLGAPTTAKTLNVDFSNNTILQTTETPQSGTVFSVNLGSASLAGSLITGTIQNNTVGSPNLLGSGSATGDGFSANSAGKGTVTLNVSGNTLHQFLLGRPLVGTAAG